MSASRPTEHAWWPFNCLCEPALTTLAQSLILSLLWTQLSFWAGKILNPVMVPAGSVLRCQHEGVFFGFFLNGRFLLKEATGLSRATEGVGEMKAKGKKKQGEGSQWAGEGGGWRWWRVTLLAHSNSGSWGGGGKKIHFCVEKEGSERWRSHCSTCVFLFFFSNPPLLKLTRTPNLGFV